MNNSKVDGWSKHTLGELVEIKHGFAFKGKHFSDLPTGIVLVTPGNFAIGGGFQETKLKYYREDVPVPSDYVLEKGDLIVTMTDLSKAGDTLGFSALVPEHIEYKLLHNQRVGLAEKISPKTSSSYLHWLMRGPGYRAEILASATGSTVRHTSPSRICNYSFALPPLDEQRRIAHVLGTLDDKIELNRQMNATLESIAQAIFKSWFVDFDGQEDFVESDELGLIPRGWEVGTLGDIAKRHKDSAKADEIADDTPYLGLGDMPQGSIVLDQWGVGKDATSTKARFERHDILFGKLRPYFKKVGIAPVDGVASSDIYVIRPKTPHWYGYVLGVLTYDPFIAFTNAVSTGTRMPRVSWKNMVSYQLALPPKELATKFNEIVQPFVERILANIEQSRTLTELRDTLLPKLISGEIRVPEALEIAGEVVGDEESEEQLTLGLS